VLGLFAVPYEAKRLSPATARPPAEGNSDDAPAG
jgi:hypothetical protein